VERVVTFTVLAVSISALRDMRCAGGIGVENAARGDPSAPTRCAVVTLRSMTCSISAMRPSATLSRSANNAGVLCVGSA
jgi:hypothetical protein